MAKHATLSPSSAYRWIACPGSIRLIQQLGTVEKSGKSAVRGTAAHSVLEALLKGNNLPDKVHIEDDGQTILVDNDMEKSVIFATDYILNQALEHDLAIHTEMFVSLKHLGINGLTGGTLDVGLIGKKDYHEIIDYKNGTQPVDVEHNTQLLTYALGALNKFDLKSNHRVKTTIIQPNGFDGNKIKSATYTLKHIKEWAKDVLIPAAKKTQTANAALNPSDKACQWCPAASSCPARNQILDKAVTHEHIDLPVVDFITPERKKFIVKNYNLIISFLNEVKNNVKNEMQEGSRYYDDCFKLVPKRTVTTWNNDSHEESTSDLFTHLTDDEIFAKKKKSISEIKKLLTEKLGGEKTKEIISDLTYKPPSDGETNLVTIDK